MTISFFRVTMVALASLLMGVAGSAQAATGHAKTQLDSNAQVAFGGQVVSVSRMRIPHGATLKTTLNDLDRRSHPVVARQIKHVSRATPMPFLVAYKPSAIIKGHHYVVETVIRDARQRPLWHSVNGHPVTFNDSGIIKGSPFILPVKRAYR